MATLKDVPAGYEVLLTELVAAGFGLQISDPDDTAFGNQIAVLIHDAVRVRLVRDRGQWFLEIAAPLTDEWFAPVVWMGFLEDELPDPTRPSPEAEAKFVADRWADFGAADPGSALAALHAWQARRAEQRRSLPPEAAL